MTNRSQEAWRFSEIQSGLPWVWAATQEAFVPQMINLELVQGVSFTKGCYPGQEIVARSQYLGKLKRRTFRADINEDHLAAANLIGQDIFAGGADSTGGTDGGDSAHSAITAVGRVVDAAKKFNSEGKPLPGLSLLVECSQDDWSKGNIRLGAPANSPTLITAQLPYAFTVVA